MQHTETGSDQGSRNEVSLLIERVEPVAKLGGDGACSPDGCDSKQNNLADDAPNNHWKVSGPILCDRAHWECTIEFNRGDQYRRKKSVSRLCPHTRKTGRAIDYWVA
jgi:hypothetical protein